VEYLRSYLDIGVMSVLVFMSFLVVWLAIERFLYDRHVDIRTYHHCEALDIDLTRNLTTLSSQPIPWQFGIHSWSLSVPIVAAPCSRARSASLAARTPIRDGYLQSTKSACALERERHSPETGATPCSRVFP